MKDERSATDQYRKDPDFEVLVEELNNGLVTSHERAYCDIDEQYPTIQIIGVPRSGTTLLYQLIASHLPLGYVNNLIAVFWRAPLYGIRLSKKLLPSELDSTLRSDFGRTRGIQEPHEFGYFWSDLLGYQDRRQQPPEFERSIDWERVARVIKNITAEFEAPTVFKCFYSGWHLAKFQQVLPKSCFVLVKRDPVQNAISLLQMRRKFLGSVEEWASLKPREFETLRREPDWRQVAGQVFFLERSFREQVSSVAGRNVLEVEYAALCADPSAVLNEVRALLAKNGCDIDLLSPPPLLQESVFDIRADPDFGRVAGAVNEFYNG